MFRFGKRPAAQRVPPPENHNPFNEVRWLEAADNHFGIRVLDCRPVAMGLTSLSADAAVAAKFLELRSSQGFDYIDKIPADAIFIPCEIRYSITNQEVADGCLFVAAVMEEKWNIYLHRGYLYFARSWTGALIARARMKFDGMQLVIDQIDANQDTASSHEFAIQMVDFLIKNHLFQLEAPHPITPGTGPTAREIALDSFSIYGRRGLFASYEDTTKARVYV
jgi:hypothetical protein